MRRLLGRLGTIAGAAMLIAVTMPGTAAHAAAASPSNINVDCASGTGATTTVIGAVGDTFTVTDTSSMGCSLANYAGVASFGGASFVAPNIFDSSGLGGNVLDVTIVGSGTFAVVKALSGDAALVAIEISGGGGGTSTDTGHVPGVGEPRPQDVPNQAGAVSATAGLYSATVSWMIPTQPGEAPVSLYEVTSAPDGKTCTATAPATTCTVKGLHIGTGYTFTVKSFNGIGWGPASAPSNAVTVLSTVPGKPRAPFSEPRSATVIEVNWSGPEVRPVAPFTYEVQAASCPRPCRGFENLAFGDMFVSHAEDDEFAAVFSTAVSLQPIVRIRTVDAGGSVSDWVYTADFGSQGLRPVTITKAYTDAGGSRLEWSDSTLPLLVSGYKVYAVTKSSWNATESAEVLVGETTNTSIDVARVKDENDFVRFKVVSIPSPIYLESRPSASASTLTAWRVQTDSVPTPVINDASFGPRSSGAFVEWGPGDGRGTFNIVRYYVQYRDASTNEWMGLQTLGPDARMALFDQVAAASINGVRVRAVTWPGRHWSGWALALN